MKVDPAWSGAVPAREGVGGLEMKVPLVEPFTRPVSTM
jgi:hypothetical protein